MTSVRVPGFLPSADGLHFPNSWPSLPIWTITLPGNVTIPIGDASNGMYGGTAYTVRDMFRDGRADAIVVKDDTVTVRRSI